MKEAISIRNAGPLRNIVLSEITPFTILIGPSGSGKSMIMKIVIIMRYIFKLCCIRSYLKNSGISRSPFRLQVNNLFRDDLKSTLLKQGVEIIYTVTLDSGDEYTIKYRDRKLSLHLNGKSNKNISDKDIVFLKESWISEARNVIPHWVANPANIKGGLGFYFHETLADFTEATRNIQNLDLGFIDGRLAIDARNGLPRYYFEVPGKHEPIELRHASSGIQTVAPLALIISYFANVFSFKDAKRRSILNYLYENDRITDFHPKTELSDMKSVINVHIEEPELSLDPISQVKMIDYLVNTAFNSATNTMTLMLATHSPYIVNALNLVINRKDSQAALAAEKVAVYSIHNGKLVNLKACTDTGVPVIDTSDLTAPMQTILEDYTNLIADC